MSLNERPVPEAAFHDPDAVEMLRVWVAQGKLHCSMKIGMYTEANVPEEKAWGTMLADVARHIANALSEGNPVKDEAALSKIRSALIDQLNEPTTDVRGGFVERH
jgi:hypothetical protein